MDIKLIAIDIDGTLLNEENQLTTETIKAVQEARDNGIKVVLCTGRPLTGVKPYLKKLGISGNQEYAITFNGSQVQDSNGRVIEKYALKHSDFKEIEKLSHELKTNFQIETNDYIYATNRDLSPFSITESYLVNMPIRVRTPEEITEDFDIIKAMLIANPDVIDNAMENIPDDLTERLSMVRSEPVFIEFMNKNATKGKALHKLAQDLNITSENVMAIGNEGNDMSMIEYAGKGVAMGNGIQKVKDVADIITKSNKEDGVAYAIRNYALK
ncbi:Cof-like hydrolase [Apilactobacillus ozensis DSM 23829 = JCM 17196]|uniref:Cof-like hydrolase n=1 Tax=Apilactobacillus ozensis DSM 23829 = JCM 17196 TaxID=1423781 RepID=A0A0R2AZ31_9LACO|nr:sugar-phosphatase [Apilactobacillus ozensis]KRM69339.1 Cof-like hydrolase [Apilactobacillus ozensis DSM 23829 = JCM 17196]